MDRERRLIDALVRLADTLVEDYDVLEFLYVLSEHCVALLEGAAAGVLLMDSTGELELAAATSADMRALEVFEGQHRQGPSFEAYRSGRAVSVADVRDRGGDWPDFVPRAVGLGYVAALGQPLRLRDERVGALNVFRDRPGPFDDDDLALSRGLADMAAIGILNSRALNAAQDQIRHLQQALESRAIVEQAKALLADRLDVPTGEAFDLLRRYARDRNHRLRDVAHRFVHGELPHHEFGQARD